MIEFALVSWFLVTALLFIFLSPHLAVATSMIFGVALLPSLRAIPVPVFPDLTQYTVPVMGSLVMMLVMHPQKLIAARPGRGAEAFILVMIGGALVTNLNNTDAQAFGPNVLPGMSVGDTINDGLRMIMRWGAPFFLGRALVRTPREAIEVLMVLALAGLFYVPFVLIELQTGPYFHALVYGATPSPTTFSQALKYGGFRPVVLMNHGLTLSSFMLYSTLSWVGLAIVKFKPLRLPAGPFIALMVVVVGFCKSRAVYIYGVTAIPALLFARPRLQLLVLCTLAVAILAYPFLRSVDMVPVDEVAAIAEEYAGYDAAQSFTSRIKTENDILARTSERYFFGWGGYARHFVYDRITGRPLSTMDGLWLIEFGTGGLFRFLTLFLFLLFPLAYALRRIGKISSPTSQSIICVICWIVALRTFDLLPNSTVDPYLTFLGGAVCGLVKFESNRPRQNPRGRGRREEPEEESQPSASLGAALGAGRGGGPRRAVQHSQGTGR